MSKIKSIRARQILDSRGNPTVEALVMLTDGVMARSSVPSGASKGTYEVVDLHDGDKSKFAGLGVLRAVENVNQIIASKLTGMDAFDQQKIDRTMIELDGTQNKSKLGANAILAVSQAVVKAASHSSLLPTSLYIRQFLSTKAVVKIPTPMFNVVEGGKHAAGFDIQEFLVIPATSKSYVESLEIGVSIYHKLGQLLHDKGQSVLVGDEGGFSPTLSTNMEGFSLVKEAIDATGLAFSLDVFMGVDAAANTFADGKTYKLKDKTTPYNDRDLVDFYKSLFENFALIYIEDPFAEDDWDGWKLMFQTLGDKTTIVGDDLTTTNPYRLQLALDNKVINGIIIKPNQIGTITEALAVVEIARYTGLKVIVSHRSGETMDTFIADFAVGVGADYVKFGAPAHERVAKYNKLLEIEEEIKKI